VANVAGQQNDVTDATNRLMKVLLEKAAGDPDNTDFALQVVQAATRWTAVRNRMNMPEEGNAFDGYRETITSGSGNGDGAISRGPTRAGPPHTESASAPSVERKARPGIKKGSRHGVIGASRLDAGTIASAFSTYHVD